MNLDRLTLMEETLAREARVLATLHDAHQFVGPLQKAWQNLRNHAKTLRGNDV